MTHINTKEQKVYVKLIYKCIDRLELLKQIDELNYINTLMERETGHNGFLGFFKKAPMTFKEAFYGVVDNFNIYFSFCSAPSYIENERIQRLRHILTVFEFADKNDTISISSNDLNFINHIANGNFELPENYDEYKKLKGIE